MAAAPALVRVVTASPPSRVVIHRRFVPWAHPSVAQVFVMARVEAAREGVSAEGLLHRIKCESTYQWWEVTGSYQGLGQFADETFHRGLSTLGSRLVVLREASVRWRKSWRVGVYADGSRRRLSARRVRQSVVLVRRGYLPAHPDVFNGWVQVRIMVQAMAGRSAVHDSEWSCST